MVSEKDSSSTILSYIKVFFWIEVHVVLKEVYVFYGTQGNHLHAQPFILLPEKNYLFL